MNPKEIVEQGYNRIAERYKEWAGNIQTEEPARCVAVLLDELPIGAKVLELGCGSGVPNGEILAQRFVVTGVDISARQIELARHNVPSATFIQADMTKLEFAPASFEAVVAFSSIIHVPREEQPGLLQNIVKWLRPGGWLVASFSSSEIEAGYEEDWLGAPMYWSGFDAATNCRMVVQAGLELVRVQEETAIEDGKPVTFLWVTARKPE